MSARRSTCMPGPGGHRGEFMAWDPVKRTKVWSITEKFPVWSGALVTAGDVAFYGTMDRWFKAVDAKTGKELWKFHADSGFIGQPVTFMGNDGVQYVAILSGVGGWPGAVANGGDRSAGAQRRARLHRRDAGPAGAHRRRQQPPGFCRRPSRRAPPYRRRRRRAAVREHSHDRRRQQDFAREQRGGRGPWCGARSCAARSAAGRCR